MKESDQWETPAWLFCLACQEIGEFGLDVCATKENKKTPRYYSEEQNGLTSDWKNDENLVWCNPPYSDPLPWVKKAIDEQQYTDAVLLLPVDVSTNWFSLCHRYAKHIWLLNQRIKFVGAKGSPKFASMFVYFGTSKINEDNYILIDKNGLKSAKNITREHTRRKPNE